MQLADICNTSTSYIGEIETGRKFPSVEMQTIPEIKIKSDILKTFLSSEFWAEVSVSKLEAVRTQVRDLIKYLTGEQKQIVQTNFADEIVEKEGKHISP